MPMVFEALAMLNSTFTALGVVCGIQSAGPNASHLWESNRGCQWLQIAKRTWSFREVSFSICTLG